MHFILTLVLMPIVALLYVAYSDMHSSVGKASVARLSNARRAVLQTDSVRRIKRRVTWITRQEFPALLRRSETVILVDLRFQRDMKSALYAGSHVLPTSPEQLRDLLPWLPPEASVVLCGPPDLCCTLISELRNSSGAAAIYILEESHSAGSQRLCLLTVFLACTIAASAACAQSTKSSLLTRVPQIQARSLPRARTKG
jgi:hypothetical protein